MASPLVSGVRRSAPHAKLRAEPRVLSLRPPSMEACDKALEETSDESQASSPACRRSSASPIDRDRTISFMGEDARVYATPRLISDVEFTCRDLILSTPTRARIRSAWRSRSSTWRRRSPAPRSRSRARITAVEGRKVTFEVSAKDEIDTVSAGTHTRFVVDVAKTKERLKAKAAKLAALTR